MKLFIVHSRIKNKEPMDKKIYHKYKNTGSSPYRVVDFRSDWALSWGRPMSRFTRVARSKVSGQQDVGHEGVITGRDGFSLRSSIADPQGVAQPPLQSTYI
jgi:hypothetical protein